jgi:signal transduction histidine kinase
MSRLGLGWQIVCPWKKMKLSTFINEQMDCILTDWDAFARTLGSVGEGMTNQALRDHAKQILQAVAKDIEREQSPDEQSRKSKGEAVDRTRSAASVHGRLRQENGFTMNQMVAEYRALRATVLRQWLPHVQQVTEATTNDMLRFNEGIDQAVAESTARFTEQTARARDTFLAILGHDLRTPLAAMSMAGEILMMPAISTTKANEIGRKVKRSAASMSAVVSDLLEYAGSQLGNAMPVNCIRADVKEVCQAAVDEAALAYPECKFELSTSGDLTGTVDKARLQQALTNLLANAAQYCSLDHPIKMLGAGTPDVLVVQVNNKGPVIAPESLDAIFDPLVQLATEEHQLGRPPTSLGLGLFIARQVVEGHNGTITAESSELSGTTFTVSLPKLPKLVN